MATVKSGSTGGARHGVEGVYVRLRSMILRGELAPGSEASQVRLAQRMGVSRTPLREALRMLQREGLVESGPNRRLRVAAFSLSDLEQLYIMRITLESAAIRLTIPKLRSEDIAGMEGYIAQITYFSEQKDFELAEVPHRAFHRALTGKVGSRIEETLSQFSDHSERYRRFYMSHRPKSFRDAVARDHRLILDAAKSADADMGARRLAAHLSRTVLAVAETIDPSYRAEAVRETLGQIVGSEDPLLTTR